MGSEVTTVDHDSVQSLVDRLVEAGQGIKKDDLAGLAKIHGSCAELTEAACGGTDEADQRLAEATSGLSREVEQLILGEAEDPDVAMACVAEHLSRLVELVGSETAPTGARTEAVPDAAIKASPDQSDAAPAPAETEPGYVPEPLRIGPNEAELAKGFVEEANEHIESVEAALLEVEQGPDDPGRIDEMFRPFHTIKGVAGFLNFRDISCLTHEAETLLDQGRKGERKITSGLIDLLFNTVDILKVQIGSIATWLADPKGDAIPQPPVAAMIGTLRAVVAGRRLIVVDDSLVAGRIEPDAHEPGPGHPDQKLGENLVEQGAVPEEVVAFGLKRQKDEASDRKLGEVLVDMNAVTPKQVSRALRPQGDADGKPAPPAASATPAEQSVRIDTRKLDTLVDMVGELVIAQTQVSASPNVATEPRLGKAVGQVTKITRDIQELGMAMRMVPIGPTFAKMTRLVRDVSRKAGKKVRLAISGEETELDKNVIQQIGDPLVHMVRNAVDHGIEAPSERRAAGKDEEGVVSLSAFHHAGNIVIEIRDDGKGLNAQSLIAKGVERGIVQPDEELTDQQAFALVFAPGFSTAAEITDISGRGVGMDVVRRNIEQLRGKVEITSELGGGSVFSIRLPLTLAIIDGMVVRVGSERFVIPTIAIELSIRPHADQINTVQGRGEMILIRGLLVPLVQLGELFRLTGSIDPTETMVVIAHTDEGRIGLVIEELVGQQQVVIKTLGQRFEMLRGISGAAILGDGRVGLILEVSGLATAAHDLRPTVSEGVETSSSAGEATGDAEIATPDAVLPPDDQSDHDPPGAGTTPSSPALALT